MVVDAETEEDLALLAAAIVELGDAVVPVGSAGLGRHLADVWGEGPRADNGTALVVVTSLHPVSRRQAERLAAAHPDRFHQPDPAVIADERRWRDWRERFLAEAPAGDGPILLMSPTEVAAGADAADIARRFAGLTSDLIERHVVGGLVVTGGDGARAVLEVLGATGLRLHDEIVSGVPRSRILGGKADGLPMVTKAGGFGEEDVLLLAADAVVTRRNRT